MNPFTLEYVNSQSLLLYHHECEKQVLNWLKSVLHALPFHEYDKWLPNEQAISYHKCLIWLVIKILLLSRFFPHFSCNKRSALHLPDVIHSHSIDACEFKHIDVLAPVFWEPANHLWTTLALERIPYKCLGLIIYNIRVVLAVILIQQVNANVLTVL